MQINYISYGIVKTGGFNHEKYLFDTLCSYYSANAKPNLIRKNKLYTHFMGYLQLLLLGFSNSFGNINIVVGRLGVSAMLRNWFSKNEVWVVLHNFDVNDGKSYLLKKYYAVLFYWLRKTKHQRFKLIVVAEFWQQYFNEIFGIKNVFLFPNFFDVPLYSNYPKNVHSKNIHLGQYSSKNDSEIFSLAQKLSEQGYSCFFTTLNKAEAIQTVNYSIQYFETFEVYLQAIANSKCTLALSIINEGWNRIAHESILLQTPVIGYKKGGLGNLLIESNSHVVSHINEAYEVIIQNKFKLIDAHFIENYKTQNAENYLKKICKAH